MILVENEPAATGVSKKLEPSYKGPFIVTKVFEKDRYVVEDIPESTRTQRHYTSVYASDKIKPWCTLPANDDYESGEDQIYETRNALQDDRNDRMADCGKQT